MVRRRCPAGRPFGENGFDCNRLKTAPGVPPCHICVTFVYLRYIPSEVSACKAEAAVPLDLHFLPFIDCSIANSVFFAAPKLIVSAYFSQR